MTIVLVEHCHAISGTIETISWSFDVESEILSFDGKGAMMDFFCDTGAKPWDELTSNVITVIADGITTIGNHALIFMQLSQHSVVSFLCSFVWSMCFCWVSTVEIRCHRKYFREIW